jgi:AhpD family alkylhydroperoxidase
MCRRTGHRLGDRPRSSPPRRCRTRGVIQRTVQIALERASERRDETRVVDHKLLTLIKTRVSQINGCAYCLHMHTQNAHKLGESDVRLFLLDAWRESNLYTVRERAALAWAESLTHIGETHAPNVVYDEARQQFSDKELADLSIAIAMFISWTRLMIGTRAVHPGDVAKAA